MLGGGGQAKRARSFSIIKMRSKCLLPSPLCGRMVGRGGLIELEIPPELAYGDAGFVDFSIPPKAVLRYRIELIDVK